MAANSVKDQENGEQLNGVNSDKGRWPWWGQLILAVIALFFAVSLLVVLPIVSVMWLGNSAAPQVSLWEPMIASLLALTSLLVTGIFLFMTFRIDRGTRLTAERTAKATAKEVAKATAEETAKATAGKIIPAIKARAEEAGRAAKKAKEKSGEAEQAATKAQEKAGVAEQAAEIAQESAEKAAATAQQEVERAAESAQQQVKQAAEEVQEEAQDAARAAQLEAENAKASARDIEEMKSQAGLGNLEEQVRKIVQEELAKSSWWRRFSKR